VTVLPSLGFLGTVMGSATLLRADGCSRAEQAADHHAHHAGPGFAFDDAGRLIAGLLVGALAFLRQKDRRLLRDWDRVLLSANR
jgi:hypothetical protein